MSCADYVRIGGDGKGEKKKWRSGWDSNPRDSFPSTRFPGVFLKPLGHRSSRRKNTLQIPLPTPF